MKRLSGILASLALAVTPWVAGADGLIASRAELMEMLGASTTDDFEAFNIIDDGTYNTGLSLIDHSTIIQGQGPNLVRPGCTYTGIRAPITWVGANYQGLPMSRTLIVWNQSAALDAELDPQLFFAVAMKYTNLPQAFGIDILRFGEMGQLTVEVYNTNDAFASEFVLPTPPAGEPMFFGYWRAGGITDVVVKNTLFGTVWSPNVDNHTYGVLGATPAEPTTWGRIKSLYR